MRWWPTLPGSRATGITAMANRAGTSTSSSTRAASSRMWPAAFTAKWPGRHSRPSPKPMWSSLSSMSGPASRRRTTTSPITCGARASPVCWRPTRPKECSRIRGGNGPRFMNWDSAPSTRCRQRLGRASAAWGGWRGWGWELVGAREEGEEGAARDLPDADGVDGADGRIIRLAVAGRPNVGKSTLINTWLGEERLVAFDTPGTTRDAITVPFERNGQRFELVDTAGLRRKGKVFAAVEKFSVVKTLQAIESAHVVLLLLDASQGVTEQDAHIAGYILESGRAVVLAVNKWDATDDYKRQLLERSIETRLAFLKFASLHPISAKNRQGLGPLWTAIVQAHKAATCKMSTPVLTRLLLAAVQFQSR